MTVTATSFIFLCTIRFVRSNSRPESPYPRGYQLVGVADEGRAHINEGIVEDNVYTLKPGTNYGTFLRWRATSSRL